MALVNSKTLKRGPYNVGLNTILEYFDKKTHHLVRLCKSTDTLTFTYSQSNIQTKQQ